MKVVRKTSDRGAQIEKAIKQLTKTRVLVGIPGSAGKHDGSELTKAQIGYLMETGDPAKNRPPRPFLVPGVKSMEDRITKALKKAAEFAFLGKPDKTADVLTGLGLKAAATVQQKIHDGPFEPLKPSTIRGRQTKSGSRSNTDPKPLYNTGEMLRAVTYIVKIGNGK